MHHNVIELIFKTYAKQSDLMHLNTAVTEKYPYRLRIMRKCTSIHYIMQLDTNATSTLYA